MLQANDASLLETLGINGDQLRVGGRQRVAGNKWGTATVTLGSVSLSVAVKLNEGTEKISTVGEAWQLCAGLQCSPVIAAVAASLQQSAEMANVICIESE